MIQVSDKFLSAIQKNVRFREMQKIEVSDNQDMSNSFFVDYGVTSSQTLDGRLHRSNMRSMKLDIKGEHLYQGKYIVLHRGVIDIDNQTEELWMNYGVFRVIEQKYDDTKTSTLLVLKDLMVNAHKPYSYEEVGITYPNTLGNLFKAVASACGLDTSVTTFKNSNVVIEEDKWSNNEYTYRDVLDQISEVAGMQTGIRNNRLDIWGLNETGLIIDLNRGKSLNVGDRFGKFNILNVTREPQHDNYVYPENANDIPKDERKEWNVVNNQIVDKDRERFAPLLFDNVKDLEYHEYKNEVQGWGIFDVGDIVTLKTRDNTLIKTILTYENITFKSMSLSVNGSKKMASIQDEYLVATDTRREGLKVYLLVDQQNGKIQSLINQIGDRSDKETSITQDIDSIELKVNSISVGTNLMPNLNAMYEVENNKYPYWEFSQLGLLPRKKPKFYPYLKTSPNFLLRKDSMSISEYAKEFYQKGIATVGNAYIVPDSIYSYRFKRTMGNDPFDITIIELNEGLEEVKRTKYTMYGQKTIETITFTPTQMTMWAKLEYTIKNDNKFRIAEEMFSRGEPTGWKEDAGEIKDWAQSRINMLDDKITLESKRIDSLDGRIGSVSLELDSAKAEISTNATLIDSLNGDIHNSGVDISAVNGIKTWGKKFVIQNENQTKDIFKVVTIAGQEQVSMYGNIQSEGGEIAFDSENKEIKIGSTYLKSQTQVGWLDVIGNGMKFEVGGANNAYGIMFGSDTIMLKMDNAMFGWLDSINPLTTSSGAGIGSETKRYQSVFLRNQPNVSSDKRYKYNIHNIDDMLLDEFEELEEKGFITKHDENYSFGYIAQDVERCLYKYILKVWGYGEANEWLGKFKLLSKSESYMSLLYAEVQVIMTAVTRRKQKRLEEENKLIKEDNKRIQMELDTLISVLKEKEVI